MTESDSAANTVRKAMEFDYLENSVRDMSVLELDNILVDLGFPLFSSGNFGINYEGPVEWAYAINQDNTNFENYSVVALRPNLFGRICS